ncbi:hypothetical protein E2986_12002 [Frieseomelitta varia]|uniref:Cytochrome P450 n=1 Tax=Frieseomelitta varia TaxID=561572 RepID=A0A833RB95_9HYME|nr:hypothetical protein E2986_12002 [Frieseomelitta varia]
MGSLAKLQTTLLNLIIKVYQLDPKAKYVGFYEFLTPVIVLRDLDLIKAVAMKNIEHFPDHSLVNTKVDPMLSGMLFMLNGNQWKDYRNMLSPTFTSSKIKTMFKLMSECAIRIAEHFRIYTSLTAFKRSLMFLIHRNAPWLAELLQLKIVDSHIAKFFYNQVAETVEDQETDGRSQARHSAAVHGQ